jgi:hypothetical protein
MAEVVFKMMRMDKIIKIADGNQLSRLNYQQREDIRNLVIAKPAPALIQQAILTHANS